MNGSTNSPGELKLHRLSDKHAKELVKIGNQVHLRSMRAAFTALMPFLLVAGLAVLLIAALSTILQGAALAQLHVWALALCKGTINVAGILIAPLAAYHLAQNKAFANPLAVALTASAALFIMLFASRTYPAISTKPGLFEQVGPSGVIAGLIIGLIAAEIHMRIARLMQPAVNPKTQVPPAALADLAALVPVLLALSIFGLVAATCFYFDFDVIFLLSCFVQQPLLAIGTSLPGFLIIYSLGNFLYTLGAHQTVINGTFLDPVLLVGMIENMAQAISGQQPTHIINTDFVTVYAQMGGTGLTLALIIAGLLVSRYQPYRDVVKLATVPGLFEINEPIIFGFPIVFNVPMIIPFVLSPVIGSLIGYFATASGFVKPLSVLVPWTTPPILSGVLASAGDWKVVLVQIIILIVCTLFYVPFIKISERVALKQAELAQE